MTWIVPKIANSTRFITLLSGLSKLLPGAVPQVHDADITCRELSQRLRYDVGLSDYRSVGKAGDSAAHRSADLDREMMRRSF